MGTETTLTEDENVCQSKRRADGSLCGKPAKYKLLPLPDGKDVARLVCGKHARHYSTKWLERL